MKIGQFQFWTTKPVWLWLKNCATSDSLVKPNVMLIHGAGHDRHEIFTLLVFAFSPFLNNWI